MEPLRTLLDRAGSQPEPILTRELFELYDGDLEIPSTRMPRPAVVANFVSTLDGVASYMVPDHASGAAISGSDPADRFLMGLLRASVDAVMVGAQTVRDVSPEALWTPASVYPEAELLYRDFRRNRLGKGECPLLVIVTASGQCDLERAVFHAPQAPVLMLTTADGEARLIAAGAAKLPSVAVRVVDAVGGRIHAGAMLQILMTQFGVRTLLHEGGPTLFGEFLAAGLIDELFLTLAPQIAGRMPRTIRPGIVEGLEYMPDTAAWFELLSLKQKAGYLYLRYRRRAAGGSGGGEAGRASG